MKKIKAISYLRVSGKGQIGGDGFVRQRKAVADLAKKRVFELVDEYRDAGVSGTVETAYRPGLSDLMARVMSNGVRTVLVERADRLARDLIVSELILAEFRKNGVQVIDSTGHDFTGENADPSTVLIRQVLGAVAQFEKSNLVLKLRAARQRMKAQQGRCEGQKPFGSLPGEETVLARIKDLYRKPRNGQHMSLGRIAAALNSEGLSSRSGKPWSRGSVWALLRH